MKELLKTQHLDSLRREGLKEEKPVWWGLQKRINRFLPTYSLAGGVLTYDSGINALVLCMHTASPEKTEEATARLFDALPDDIKKDLKKYNIGFVGRQI